MAHYGPLNIEELAQKLGIQPVMPGYRGQVITDSNGLCYPLVDFFAKLVERIEKLEQALNGER